MKLVSVEEFKVKEEFELKEIDFNSNLRTLEKAKQSKNGRYVPLKIMLWISSSVSPTSDRLSETLPIGSINFVNPPFLVEIFESSLKKNIQKNGIK